MPPCGVLVDIDGTLYDEPLTYCRLLSEFFGIAVGHDEIDQWALVGQLKGDEFDRLVRDGLHRDDTILSNVPYESAAETLRGWADAGVKIHLISSRRPSTRAVTMVWLAQHGIPWHALVCEKPIDKVAYARAHHLSLMIDDCPATLDAAVAAGIPIATIALRWSLPTIARHHQILAAATWRDLNLLIEVA